MPNDDSSVGLEEQEAGVAGAPGSLAGMSQPLEGGAMPAGMPAPDPMSGVPETPHLHQGLIGAISGRLQESAGIPPSKQVQSTYGGLLTGLAGVLIDGLAAGVSTPPGRGAGALAAARGMQMTLANRQAAAAEEARARGEMTPDQANIVKSMDRHVKGQQMLPLVSGMTPDEQEAYMRPYVGAINRAVENGYIQPISKTMNRADAFAQVQNLRGQAGRDGAHIDIFPVGEVNGQVEWMVARYDPNKVLEKDMNFTLGGYMDEQGVFQKEPGTIPAGTTVGDALNYMQTAFTNHAHNISLIREAKAGKGNAAAFQDAIFQRTQELNALRKSPEEISNDPVLKGLQAGAQLLAPATAKTLTPAEEEEASYQQAVAQTPPGEKPPTRLEHHQQWEGGKTSTQIIQQPDPVTGQLHDVMIDKKSGAAIRDLGPSAKQPPQQREALTALTRPRNTYMDTERQISDFDATLRAGATGNQVASALAGLEGTLLITSSAGVRRINTVELGKLSPEEESLVRRVNAQFDKWTSGTLPPDYIRDLRQIVDIYRKKNEEEYKKAVDGINKQYGAKVPYGFGMDKQPQETPAPGTSPGTAPGMTTQPPAPATQPYWEQFQKEQ